MLKFLYLCGKKDNEVLWYAMQAAAIKKCNQYKKTNLTYNVLARNASLFYFY